MTRLPHGHRTRWPRPPPAVTAATARGHRVPPHAVATATARGHRVPAHAVATATARGNRAAAPLRHIIGKRSHLGFAAISIFLHVFCSAEKRLTIRTRTYRGRAPEAAPDHRT